MRENGIELSTIGFLSWVGLAYSLKFLWAPLVDKTRRAAVRSLAGPAPRLDAAFAAGGRRRAGRHGAGAAAQGQLVLAGVVLDQLLVFGALALVVAFASATQDIVIDAWRIESADNSEQQGLLTSTSALGYRAALLVTDSLILIFAAQHRLVVVVRGDGGADGRRRDRGVGGARAEAASVGRRRRRIRRCSRRWACSMR